MQRKGFTNGPFFSKVKPNSIKIFKSWRPDRVFGRVGHLYALGDRMREAQFSLQVSKYPTFIQQSANGRDVFTSVKIKSSRVK